MNLPLFIAGRYLFARKSHNVINIISAISAAGMAVGTAAMVVILSVYNGFDRIIRDSLDETDPDILVCPARGKVLDSGRVVPLLSSTEGIADWSCVLEESVYLEYDGRQGLAKARGVEPGRGEWLLEEGERDLCAVGVGIARKMGINPEFVSPLCLYFPDREKNISLVNPSAALHSASVGVKCTFSHGVESDNYLIMVPLRTMRALLGYEQEASAVQVMLPDGTAPREIRRMVRALSHDLGEDFLVKDRIMQNETMLRMMRYEKLSVFMILFFVVVIIAFNIYGSLSMLMIEKKEDMETLRSLGAGEKTIRRTFILEGWMISLLGLVTGLCAGLLLSWLQGRFGFVKVPGNLAINSYPVVIRGGDVALAAACIAAVGYLIALLPVKKCWNQEKLLYLRPHSKR